MDCLDADEQGDHNERRGVEKRGQDGDTVEAVSMLGGRGLLSYPYCVSGEAQRQRVTQVMACIRKQREGMRHPPCNRFPATEKQSDGQREPEFLAACSPVSMPGVFRHCCSLSFWKLCATQWHR